MSQITHKPSRKQSRSAATGTKKISAASLRRMQWNVGLILLNGELKNPKAVRRLVKSGAALLCTDGGVRHAASLGLEPGLVIGDMDSLPKRLPRWKNTVYVCNFDQNKSDFEKALQFCARRNLQAVWVAGALGGRLDHELVNLALIERYSQFFRTSLAEQAAWILGPGDHPIPCRRGRTISLLPATPTARVSASGVRYPLRRCDLVRSSRGLSNQATAGEVRVRVHRGRLWIVLP